MKGSVIFRLFCIAALYVLLCIWYVSRLVITESEINLRTLLPIVISGIIIFVPLYKKYFKGENKRD